jgi:hypothetical protein
MTSTQYDAVLHNETLVRSVRAMYATGNWSQSALAVQLTRTGKKRGYKMTGLEALGLIDAMLGDVA